MAPSAEAQDPVNILDDWIHRTQNLPEEIRFMQDEIADKDRTYNECIKTIEENDNKIQKWVRAHGSHHPNPRESQWREVIRENYARADKLANEKIALAQKMQTLYDKHLRHLDAQIKQLYDRGEPGFTDPDEIPSVLRPSAANHSNTSLRVLSVANTPLNPISNNATPAGGRGTTLHIRTQSQTQHPSSAPASPAATMLLNRNQRESSAGPGGNVGPKRGPRASSGLVPAPSSGLARHSSLGPGTPKAGTPGASGRSGSAGPRANLKGSAAGSRKGTPSGAGVARKKPPSKSTLSRVKRAGATSKKGSPASADSELSDADSLPSSRGGRTASRAASGTPVPSQSVPHSRTHSHSHSNSQASSAHGGGGSGGINATKKKDKAKDKDKDKDGDESMADAADEDDASVASSASDHEDEEDVEDEDEDEDDEEEDEEGKRYCFCQHVSYGDMVACDNPSCPYEWFHWTCVGLKSEPEGRWFCPTCSKKNK